MVSVQKTTRRLLFMIYVGRFDENDIKHGIDKQKVKKAIQKKTQPEIHQCEIGQTGRKSHCH